MASIRRGAQSKVSRLTAGGRKLTYVLTVIQEPERARACGSGAKSSADRRPVDPPPVVELRIFEGEGEKDDITFGYSANFFLFATLEVARPIANGRLHPSAPQQVPVLTGMPVSGMAYLDRPTEAGYFIFPDLSVRHEGSYKLSFNLYEETKDAQDVDAEPRHDQKPQVAGSSAPNSSFDWRLEVKSREFMVFSAKKFPGLKESTQLSRQVAEQGCRVRIRRDVRMRRRNEEKGAGDYDELPEEYSRGRTSDQDGYERERSRSLSGSAESSPHRGPGDTHQPYPPYGHPLSQQPNPHGHLSFGAPADGQYQSRPQFAAPPPPPPPMPQQYHQPPPAPPSYPQQQAQYRPPPPPPPQNNYAYDRSYPHSAYPSNPPREHFEPEHRRASMAYPPSHTSREYQPMEASYKQPNYQAPSYTRPASPPPPSPVNLAPIKVSLMEPKPIQSSPLAPVHRIAPFPNTTYERTQERSGGYSQYPSHSQTQPVEPVRNGKRSYDAVFKSSMASQPLFNGQRPGSSHGDDNQDDDDDMAIEQLKMNYKRADGTSFSRALPTLE